MFQLVCVGEQSLIVLKLWIQQLLGSPVGGGVGNVLEVFLCNVRAAEEIDPFFCIFFIFRVFRNYPGINPDICALLGDYVFQLIVQILSAASSWIKSISPE